MLIKSPDGGKTGTKYQLHFSAGHVQFTPVAAVYLKGDNTIDEIPVTGVPSTLDKIETLENYLAHHNDNFPLYLVVE